MMSTNSQPLGYKPSALTIELNSSKAGCLPIELNSSKTIAGKKLSLSSWCIVSLYIYKYIVMQYTNWINSTPSQ